MANQLTAREFLQRHPMLTLPQILGPLPTHRSDPDCFRLIPVSKSGWQNGVNAGYYPKPVKKGRRSFWRAADIAKLLEIEI